MEPTSMGLVILGLIAIVIFVVLVYAIFDGVASWLKSTNDIHYGIDYKNDKK